ncbi:hypothetical protein BC835DRAFT_610062 [Cytidiella melzeri]|nr:hypothetical protein BC835DRAFT_610062 [Cytidiella melzeri]
MDAQKGPPTIFDVSISLVDLHLPWYTSTRTQYSATVHNSPSQRAHSYILSSLYRERERVQKSLTNSTLTLCHQAHLADNLRWTDPIIPTILRLTPQSKANSPSEHIPQSQIQELASEARKSLATVCINRGPRLQRSTHASVAHLLTFGDHAGSSQRLYTPFPIQKSRQNDRAYCILLDCERVLGL